MPSWDVQPGDTWGSNCQSDRGLGGDWPHPHLFLSSSPTPGVWGQKMAKSLTGLDRKETQRARVLSEVLEQVRERKELN